MDPGGGDLMSRFREQEEYMEAWVIRQAGFLKILTASPPILFSGTQQRCFGRLLWGHAEMRADRELRNSGAVGKAEVRIFREALRHRHGVDLDLFAEDYWRYLDGTIDPVDVPPPDPDKDPVRVLLVQRAEQDLRLFHDLEGLAAAGLKPLAKDGEVMWRIADDLPERTVVQQAAVLASTDVLVGAVGAGLAWLVAMRPGGQVLEWLPRGVPPSLYRCSEVWNADTLGMFGGLGRLADVDHVCLRSEAEPPTFPERLRYSAVRSTTKDAYWRRENLRVDVKKFARWVAEAVARARRTRAPRLEPGVEGPS
uniref:Glycosyltransferase 61 catalytic domain-containing protein n=1 Tax=Alexandrium monilatum TaxID=311494 RepID=A0A7S4SAQ0_9DINO